MCAECEWVKDDQENSLHLFELEDISFCFSFRAVVLRTKACSTQTGSYVLPRQFPTKMANAPSRVPQVATGDLPLTEGKMQDNSIVVSVGA